MDAATRNLVRRRARNRCEYCGLRQDQSPLATLHMEHIRPKKHGGSDEQTNLALACIDCNLHKGTDLAGYDPTTGSLTEFFNPRVQVWSEHFEWDGLRIVGRTPTGRTTVEVFRMNAEERLQVRAVSLTDE
jgi:hypothetical protein